MLTTDGVDANAVDERGGTASFLAAWQSHLETLTVLIGAGASLEAALHTPGKTDSTYDRC